MALVALVVLFNPPVVFVMDLLALGVGIEKLASAFSEYKLSMNNREIRTIAQIVFM